MCVTNYAPMTQKRFSLILGKKIESTRLPSRNKEKILSIVAKLLINVPEMAFWKYHRKKKCEVMASTAKEEIRSYLPFKLYLDLDSTK